MEDVMINCQNEGDHEWEPDIFPDDRSWWGCKKCLALGREEAGKIVAVKCIETDCAGHAITLNKRKPDMPPVPVCEYHFVGVIIP